jgi:site-specific DNA-methyltransferase (adenine-specific)
VADYELYHGDCLEVMPTLPASSVSLVLADLPYGVTACAWDSVIPLAPLWEQYKRLLKPRGAVVLTATQPFTSALVMSNPQWFRYEWVWVKSRRTGYSNCKNAPMKGHESVLVFSRATYGNGSHLRMNYNPQGLKPMLKVITKDGSDNRHHRPGRAVKAYTYEQTATGYPSTVLSFASESSPVHPTQKPVALGEYLIRTYTNPGDLVLDNTCGSGSFGVAALNTGRRFIGIERDPNYFKIAEQRLADAARQGRLELERAS